MKHARVDDHLAAGARDLGEALDAAQLVLEARDLKFTTADLIAAAALILAHKPRVIGRIEAPAPSHSGIENP